MRLIDADELLERMRTRCELCQYKERPCRRECDWHEAMDEVEDSPDVGAMTVTATGNAIAAGVVKGGITVHRTIVNQHAKEVTHIGHVEVFNA